MGLLEMHGKSTCRQERLTTVVIIGRIVAETCFMTEAETGLRSHCLLGEASKSLAISSIDAGGNNDNTLVVRGGFE